MSANADYLKKHGWTLVYEKKAGSYSYKLWSKGDRRRITTTEAMKIERPRAVKLNPDIGGRRVEPKPPME